MRRSIFLLVVALFTGCDNRSLPQADSGPGSDAIAPGKDAGKPVPDGLAGCSQNSQCASTAYCKIEGACAVTGAKLGVCTPRPTSCDTIYAPVCGCDGKTHGNACGAASAGVNVSYQGECKQRCGDLMYLPACPSSEICNLTSCATVEGSCVKKPTPAECSLESGPAVCGCDGKTYATDCERLLAGVARAALGACPTTSGITVVTDKTSYTSGQNVKATLSNGTLASVFLAGCAAYAIERKEGGVFVDKGTTGPVCAWEGIAKEVKPGASLTENVSPSKGGSYRIRADYGLGCTPGKALSEAACTAFGKAHSASFVVQPDAKTCLGLIASYAGALSVAKSCDSSINTPQCLHKVLESLACGCDTYVNNKTGLESIQTQWEDLGCAGLPGLPACPPKPCAAPKGSTCASGLCKDLFQ